MQRTTHGTSGDGTSAGACSEFTACRRTLLKGAAATAGLVGFNTLGGGVFRQVAMATEASNGNVLVVLSLRGGADGLSMVVPHGDPGYAVARPKIGIPTETLLARDAMFGLHPGFAPLLPMWEAKKFGAVHAVGLPQPNRSHFAAMEEMEDADLGSAERRGWLNRLVGLSGTTDPLSAVQLGRAVVPTSLYGSSPVVTADHLGALRLVTPPTASKATRKRAGLEHTWAVEADALGRSARATLSTTDRVATLATTTEAPHNGAVYPAGSSLGETLAETARLLRFGGVDTVAIDYGNWDLHVTFGGWDAGPMADQVAELAGAISAFFTDLGPLGDKVTLVTVSEFGRRVQENGARGLDHGYGNAMLMFGAGIAGGQVHGNWPGLTHGNLINGDLAVTRDYRSVLAEIVARQFPSRSTAEVFPGFLPEQVGVTLSP
jgi:uncharacterized protein (DUF1501 family)